MIKFKSVQSILLISFILFCFPGNGFAYKTWAISGSYKVKPVKTENPDGKLNEFFSFFVGSGYQQHKDYTEKNYIWDSSQSKVFLSGAKNEVLSFQLIIDSQEETLNNVWVQMSNLVGRSASIPSSHFKLFKANYVDISKLHAWSRGGSTGPGDYPDALIPLEKGTSWGAPFKVEKGRNQIVWVDVYIPKKIPAGVYKGKIKITDENEPQKLLNFELNVFNFAIPSKNHLPFWGCANPGEIRLGFGWSWNEVYKDKFRHLHEIEKNLWKMGHRFRLTVMSRNGHFLPYRDYHLEPGTDKLDVDWRQWDKRFKGFIDGSLFRDKTKPPIFILPISGGAENRVPRNDKFKAGKHPDDLFIGAIRAFTQHLKKIGWDYKKRPTFIYLSDERSKKYFDRIIHDAKIIQRVAPGIKTAVYTWNYKDFDKTFPYLKNYVDYWNASAEGFEIKKLQAWRKEKKGRLIGLYQGDGDPRLGRDSIDAEGLSIRTWPWVVWKYHIDTLYMYLINSTHNYSLKNYKMGANPFIYTYTQFGWGQGMWVYPGRWIGYPKYLPSIRLEEVRRGMQDYEYLWLAKKDGQDADSVANSLIFSALSQSKPIIKGSLFQRQKYVFGNWEHDPEKWHEARMKLAKMILNSKSK